MNKRLVAGGFAAVLLAGALGSRAAASEVHIRSDRNRDAYTLFGGGHSITTNLSIEELTRIQHRLGGAGLWARRHGKEYVVTDSGKIAEAQKLFEAMRALEPEQKELARRQREVERRGEAIDRELEKLENRIERASRADRDPEWVRRRHELRAQERQTEAEGRALDAEDRVLDHRVERLEREAEAKLWGLIDDWIASGEARRDSER